MKDIIAEHSREVFLKPGEIIVSQNPIMVNTILGSCVAVTMYSPGRKAGAICHAIHPSEPKQERNFHYVETAIRNIYDRMIEYGCMADLVVKLFGGAQVLEFGLNASREKTIGAQNILQAKRVLEELGLPIAGTDVGGNRGRKLFFSIKTGDVYVRRLRLSKNMYLQGMLQ
jgi:chemotaxis protein CheD